MTQLVLFINELGGENEETWNKFSNLIAYDSILNDFDAKTYTYPTRLVSNRKLLQSNSHTTDKLKLPIIREIAQSLKSEIDQRYKNYNKIYIIAEGTGSLIAKKYLIDELSIISDDELKVEKLLTYKIPSEDPSWARLSKTYNHNEMKELNRSYSTTKILQSA